MNDGSDSRPPAFRAHLASLPGGRRQEELVAHLCTRAAHFLHLPDVRSVGPETSWVDLGFDSLRAVDFRSELATALGLELRSTLLFDHVHAAALASHLLTLLAFEPSHTAPPSPPPLPVNTTANEPIAIVGAACRFPGGEDLESFWQLLAAGRDAIAPIPPERFDLEALYDPDPAAEGKIYVREAGLLRDVDRFDAAFFGISPREALLLDPMQRLLLEVSWHALEHANLPPAALSEQCVGVYLGTRASEYFDSQTARTPADASAYYPTGDALSTAAGRLSYTFGFRGPCYALDTACSGSLVAVHIAVRALRARECDVALAGGVNVIFDPVSMAGLCRARMLAPDGRSKSFDATANGYGRGEGCGIVVCKRLADAEAAGDRILGVVRGTSINQDGRSAGLTVPHGPAQATVIRQALADAGLGPDAIDYVEAHGTGTALGDPIEANALNTVFGQRLRPLPIGSVKTNIGHLEAAAGISGLLKTVLALRERTLPATLHFRVPNPHIDWAQSRVQVTAERTPLPGNATLHAGVSSFGFSGTNCHVVISSAPSAVSSCAPVAAPTPRGPWLLPLQAADKDALRALASAHAEALAAADSDLATWCHAAAVARAALPHRAAFVASTKQELTVALQEFAAGDDSAATACGHAAAPPPRVAFLFPGQGAQRAGMGKELHADEPVFRDALEAAAARLHGLLPAPLLQLLFGESTALLDRTDVTQPALCAYELALLALFRSVRVVPDHVLGQSVGDFAAAVAAGVMDGSDALRLCAARGRLMVDLCPPGGMLAVLAPLARWQALLALHPRVTIAVRNAEANVVVGGDPHELDALQQRLEAAGLRTRRLPVSHAFHTASTDPMLAAFEERTAAIRLRQPECAFLDNRTGQLADASVATAQHWRAHVRDAVHFQRSVQTLAASPCSVWVELGPVPMLTTIVGENGVRGRRLLAAQRPRDAGRSGFLRTIAELWTLGVAVDLAACNHRHGPARATLPLYPFQRRRVWPEKRPSPTVRTGDHPLLGARHESSLLASAQQLFGNTITATDPSWLADHQALGHVLLPAAAMIEMALAAEFAAGTPLPITLRNASLRASCPLLGTPVRIELLRTMTEHGATCVVKGKDDGGTWRTHFEGNTAVGAAEPPLDLAAIRARCRTECTPMELYARCEVLLMQYGPAFRGVSAIYCGHDETLTRVELPPGLDAQPFVLHPALLDACFHALVAAMPATDTPLLPVGVEAVTVHRRGLRAVWCHLRLRTTPHRVGDFVLTDDHGVVLASVRGLQLLPASPAALTEPTTREWLHHVAWETAGSAPPGPAPTTMGLIGWPTLARALQQRLPPGCAHIADLASLPTLLTTQNLTALAFLAEPGDDEPMVAQERLFGNALATLQLALRSAKRTRLVLVTHGVQAAAPAPHIGIPHGASLLGLWRTLALEHAATRPLAIDLDPQLPASCVAEHAEALLAELSGPGDEPEVALRTGQRRVPRLRRSLRAQDTLPLPSGPFRLRTSAYGSFDQLTCVPHARRAPGHGEVEVAMTAAALNFKDVLHARGLLRRFAEQAGIRTASEQPLGFEGSGVVTAVGDTVATVRVGDHVAVLSADCLGSYVTTKASAVIVLPAKLDLFAAAGVPIVFATVVYALLELAAVQAGEVVLVHAAAGGVGQAAMQVLRKRGCRVLATASKPKQAFVRTLGGEVVGDTRAADFVTAALAATNGRGVDVVLNTLGGDTIQKSLQCLVVGGRFVELGKMTVWTAAQVHAARPDVRHFAFDLGDELQRDTAMTARLLANVQQGLANGDYQPPTATVVPLTQVRAAFQHLAKGAHIGKVVITLATRQPETLRADRTYLLTGASGGTAKAIAMALVDAGAQQLGLLARSDVPPTLLASLHARGCRIATVRCDVSDRTSLQQALEQVRATMPTIGGVVHAAGTLADSMLTNLEWQHAAVALRPKVAGAVWLDALLADDPLDFFVLMTSMAGTLGNPGQAAYAAANTFLDAFAAARRARGRPGTALAFGPWDGGGMSTRLDARLRASLLQRGITFMPATIASQLLVRHRHAANSLAILPVHWPTWLAPFGDAVPKPWRELRPDRTAVVTTPATIGLGQVAAPERYATLRRAVRAQVAAVLGFAEPEQLDVGCTFRDLGLDSLLAVDAKDRLERVLGGPLPATLLFEFPDLDRLTAHLFERLFGEAPTTAASTP